MSPAVRVVVSVAAVLHLTCNPVVMVAPPGSTITLIANPPFIPAHTGQSTIFAHLMEATGVPVVDGTVVQFFTNLGRIEEQGRTNDGVAQVKFLADSRSGTATISAFSGGGSAPTAPSTDPAARPQPSTGGAFVQSSVTVTIGGTLVRTVFVSATPARITTSRSSRIVATVLDGSGNPVPNVAAYFFVGRSTGAVPTSTPAPVSTPTPRPAATPTPDPRSTARPTATSTPAPTATAAPRPADPLPAPTLSDRMDSAGNPIFTDNNGRAEDVLRTSSPVGSAPYVLTVTVRVVGDGGNIVQGTVDVTVN